MNKKWFNSFKITSQTLQRNLQPVFQQGLTFVLVLRWKLWPCSPSCSQSAVEDSVSSLGHAKEYEIGLLLRMGLRKRMTRTRRRRQRRWGQGGSWAPDSCSHCCCSHWHSRCYPRGPNHCFHPLHPHHHPVAPRGSCSCQPCVVLTQPTQNTHRYFRLLVISSTKAHYDTKKDKGYLRIL